MKYQSYSDEEQLIYEDDDDDEFWGDEDLPQLEQDNKKAQQAPNKQVEFSTSFDSEYFVDRTLTSYSAPANHIWNLNTKIG